MHNNDPPEIFLETLRAKFMGGEWPSETELKTLLGFCSHPAKSLREACLTLLLQPPVTDELTYHRLLVCFLMGKGGQIRCFPEPVLELLCELLGMLAKIPEEPKMGAFFVRVLKALPKPVVRKLLEKTYPLEPFVQYVPLKSFLASPGTPVLTLKRRWRLLCKRLRQVPTASSWAQLTFTDLGGLFKRGDLRHHPVIPSGRWLLSGRVLVFPEATNARVPSAMPLERCFWRAYGSPTLCNFDHLLNGLAEELRSARELAQAVSERTRRVVLSWHNATLAASSGWAFEHLSASFPSRSIWKNIKTSVRKQVQERICARGHHPVTEKRLEELWTERLVLPKVLSLFWEEKVLASFDPLHPAQQEEHLDAVRSLLQASEPAFMTAPKGYGWPGLVGPHQRFPLREILGWSSWHRKSWVRGLYRLSALIQEGQFLMDQGLLPHLVLPWIDKFFISSRRKEDWEYLVTLVRWLEKQGTRPLILFWDDTPHAQEPSLKLMLRGLWERGNPYRGIGVFDWEGSHRSDAIEMISNEHQKTVLFALRPYSDVHNPRSLQQLLEDRDTLFFQDYDSSWKDGLCFLYAGTQVFPLLSVQTEMENFPAWLGAKGAKYPFGTYLRGRLRKAVLGESDGRGDAFSREYALWSNLC
jgi:hypothetical protein